VNVHDGFDLSVSRWLDGEASPAEAAAVEARIAADPALAAAVARCRAAGEALRDDVPAPSRGLASRVYLEAVGGRAEAERFHALARRYAAAAGVILALGVGGSIWVERGSSSATAGEPAGTLADLAAQRRVEVSYGMLDSVATAGSDARPGGR
jgi:anti-sigma factor RsiW